MDLGKYIVGQIVWIPAISHGGFGEELDPSVCAGKYYKVGTVASTPLTFNKFDSETGVYYAVIDTSGLATGVYMVLVEATVDGLERNATHVFQVEPAGAAALTLSPVAVGDCLSVADISAMIDTTDYTDTQLQIMLDIAFGMITESMGHAFGRAFRIYHDESVAATAATIAIDSTKVTLVITGGANAGTYEYTFAAYSDIGDLVVAINDEDIGFIASLLDVIPYDQPSENLKALSETSVFGYENRITVQLRQWTECMDGDNKHILQTRFPIRTIVSVTEDGTTLTAGTDYYVKRYGVERICCVGYSGSCWRADYWSCLGACNVCLTYIPTWFGICPSAFVNALLGFTQIGLETSADGHYQSEQIGDYRYVRGKLADNYGAYYQSLMKYEALPHFL